MEKELKKAIIEKVFEHEDNFQLTNYIKEQFRAYVYDEKGEYLIGGEKVAKFIDDVIVLLK